MPHPYAQGLVFALATYGAIAAATALVLARRLPGPWGAPRVLAAAVVFTTGVVFAHVVPLALGVLSRGTALGTAILALLMVAAWTRGPRAGPVLVAAPVPPASRAPSAILAVVGLGAALAALLTFEKLTATSPVLGFDSLTFHLPNVARWIQHGTLWRIDQFEPGLAHGNYPQNGELVTLSAVLPWRDPFAAREVMAVYYLLAGVATYALARELRAPRAASALFAAVLLAVPIGITAPVINALPDGLMLAMFGAGVTFLLRHWRTGAHADLVLGGVALGLAFGTKWYAVSSVGAVLAVWILGGIVARRGVGASLVRGAAALGLVLGAGGIWMVRNLVESANPVFPQKVAPLGMTIFDAPYDHLRALGGFKVSDYLLSGSVIRHYLWPTYREVLSLPGLVVLATVALVLLGAIATARRPLGRRVPDEVMALAVLVVALVAIYMITPFSAFGPRDRPVLAGVNTRYVMPALLVGAAVTAWAAGRLARLGVALELAGVVAVFAGLAKAYDLPRGQSVAAFALVLAVAAVSWWLRGRRLPRGAPALAGLAGVALVAAALGHAKSRIDDHGYRGVDAAMDRLLAEAPTGHRIGLAGIVDSGGLPPVLPAMGQGLGNDVAYVGHFVAHRLADYGDAASFTGALRAGRYDLLLVGHGNPPRPRVRAIDWARGAGFVPIADSGRFTLLRAP